MIDHDDPRFGALFERVADAPDPVLAAFESHYLAEAAALRNADPGAYEQLVTRLRDVAGLRVPQWEAEVRKRAGAAAEFAALLARERIARRPVDPDAVGLFGDAYTDAYNAARLAVEHRGALRYVPERGWLGYAEGRWTEDETRPTAAAVATLRRLAVAAVDETDDPAEAVKLVARLRSARAARAAVELATPELVARPVDFDRDADAFNVANGTLDLRTGALRPHDPADLCTQQSPVTYDATAACPRWDAFLAEVQPDVAVRGFLQRLVGYWMSGQIAEHVFPIFWGAGGNGKGTFFEVLQRVMGSYAAPIPVESLTEREHDPHPEERARLKGLRLAVASEFKPSRRLDDGTIKLLTGGDPISARFLHKNRFEFWPTHKLALITNPKPSLRTIDDAVTRRVIFIPFLVKIPAGRAVTNLASQLATELPGVLNWCLWGHAMWRQEGLKPPDVIMEATKEYLSQEDVIGRFVESECHISPEIRTKASALYGAFVMWCKRENVGARSQKEFGSSLGRMGFSSHKSNGTYLYSGIGIKDPEQGESRGPWGVLDHSPKSSTYAHAPELVFRESSRSSLPSPDTNGRKKCSRHGYEFMGSCGECGDDPPEGFDPFSR